MTTVVEALYYFIYKTIKRGCCIEQNEISFSNLQIKSSNLCGNEINYFSEKYHDNRDFWKRLIMTI